MAEYETITLTPKLIKEKAILFSDGVNEEWIPISQILECDPEYLEVGEEMDFEIKKWILEDKGFI